MLLLTLGLAVGALALAALAADPGGRRRAPLGALLLAYLAPAVFLFLALLFSRGDTTRHRLALIGVGFRGEAGGEFRVPVGGDRERDGVWISALADERPGRSPTLGHFVFHPPGTEDAGSVTFEAAPGVHGGFLGIRPEDGPLRPWRAIELADGDRITVAGRSWQVELDTGLLGPPARLVGGNEDGAEPKTVDFPPRVGALPLGVPLRILRPLPAVIETYSLGWLERAVTGEAPAGSPPGFFFWQSRGLLGRRLWLAATGEDVAVERGGEAVAIPEPPLDAVRSVHVMSPPRWSGDRLAGGGIRDRRSFRILPGRRSFAVLYDTPEVHVLSSETLAELALETPDESAGDGGERPEEVRFNLSMGGWQVTEKSLYFRHASRRVALEALATLEAPSELLEGRDDVLLTTATPRGQRRGRLGEALWLGGENLAAVRFDVLDVPLGLALLALGLAVAKAFAARAGRLAFAHLLFAAPLEALVSFRLLLGYRAWALPPFELEALELALAAWALLPWSFLVASASAGDDDGRRRFLDVLPALGGWLFALAWCRTFGGGGVRTAVWALCLTAALAVWAFRAFDLGRRLGDLAAGWSRPELTYRKVLGLWALAGFLPTLARVALLALGNRESLLVGSQRFALSLVHVPLALLLEAGCLLWLWRRVTDERELRFADLTPALAIVAGTWLLPALFANDLGLALLNVPVFLLALAAVALAAGRRLAEERHLRVERLVAATPAVVLVAYLAFAAFPIGARLLIAALPAKAELELESERNYLRLLAFAYPERLEQVARRSSEQLSVMSSVMASYTSGPFTGRGYFASEVSPHIRATALREHAPAVFVAAEWGLAGILGLIAVFAVAGVAGRAAAVWNAEDDDGFAAGGAAAFWGTAAFLAGLTIAIPSVYMILANYRLTLFTGKNAYLLGLDSTADVLEAFLLVMLFAFGASVSRDEEDNP